MFDLAVIQAAIRESSLDGWLLYDFRGLNPLARRIVQIDGHGLLSRRWFYFIPADGEPLQLMHRIEPRSLAHLPGSPIHYSRWQELEAGVAWLLQGRSRVAMEYVPRNANPYISRVDAGTIELVRSCGVEPVSSGDLIQRFEAVWDAEQWRLHQEAAVVTHAAFDVAYRFILDRVKANGQVHETEVVERIRSHFQEHDCITDHGPNCSVGPHSGDPHYEPEPGPDGVIRPGAFVLIDLWAKKIHPRAVYSDLTWTCFLGREVPERYEQVFQVVAAGRDAGIERVRSAFASGESLQGWQVDRATRDSLIAGGHGDAFIHRTGHSLGQEVHGNGANMDDLETHEERLVMAGTGFTIEPGAYYPEFGIRSETNLFVDWNGQVHVTGGPLQSRIVALDLENGRVLHR
jgi:Xaa-Pro aminopeptidase